MIAVIDTNVLVSGLINASGFPGRVVDLVRAGELVPVTDDRIMREYYDVLHRPALSRWFGQTEADQIVAYIQTDGYQVIARQCAGGLPDPCDSMFLEVAIEASAVLITGNIKHFPDDLRHGVEIVTPSQFLDSYFH